MIAQNINNTSLTLTSMFRTNVTNTHAELLFEAVGGGFLITLPILFSSLTEDQSFLVQKQVSLHGLKPCQLHHFHVTSLMLRPHAE